MAAMNQQTEYRKGKRCHVCIGCGQCFGEKKGIYVLEEMVEGVHEPTLGRKNAENIKEEYLIVADIGTTTIAMQLYDKDGKKLDTYAVVNPQTLYGADVLSRIQAAKIPEDGEKLTQMVRCVLQKGIKQFRNKIDVPQDGQATKMVIAANTTMVYLLMGWDASELGEAPFLASHLEPVETSIEGIPCFIFSGLSAFVGGDIVAGILACGMSESEKITLLVDLGTNGEMVLGNCKKMIACATSAGPAFEGGPNRGIWGSHMIGLVATLRREGILDETGLLCAPYFEEGVRIGDVLITQEAVRAIQLAKGAIFAGIQILVQEYGIVIEQIDRVVLSGGFGYHLNPQDAVEIGLFPKELAEKVVTGGNTALAGALRYARTGRNDLLQKETPVEVVNLAEYPGFQELYIDAMSLGNSHS